MQATVTPAHRRLQAHLQETLGPELVIVCTGVDGFPGSLWSEERVGISAAIPRRQREFAAGRAAARAAMRRLGLRECAIPARQDRSPAWPEAMVGSISHTSDTCIASLGRRDKWISVGIDIEHDQGISEELWRAICTPYEMQCLGDLDQSMQAVAATQLFSAKEAYFKWQFPLTGQMMDFQEVCGSFNLTRDVFTIRQINHSFARLNDVPVVRVIRLEGVIVAFCATQVL